MQWSGISLSLLACMLVLTSCKEAGPPAEASEYARLGPAIDRLREANNADKEALLAALRTQSCEHHCGLQDLCVRAYELHVAALTRVARVRALVLSRVGSREEQKAAEVQLKEAERELDMSRRLTADCAQAQTASRPR